jgi:nitric oxide reductase subunit B
MSHPIGARIGCTGNRRSLLNTWAVRAGAANFDALGPDQQAIFKARLIREMRTNTYDASRNRVTLSADRAAAFEQLRAYYTDVFATGRSEYAIPNGALTNPAKQHQLAAFFWWTSWACSTDRPGSETTYTNNWPHEPLIGNVPTSGAVLWSVLSFVGLLAGIGGLVWWYASQEKELVHGPYPEKDPFLAFKPTPSQRATLKYFYVVVILWGVQILMGILTAHYGVEGQVSLASRSPSTCPTPSRAHGICKSPSSGSQRRGWQQVFTLGRPSVGTSPSISASA